MNRRQEMPSFAESVEQLAAFFRRNGYVRWQNAERLTEEGWWGYKKGDEIRFVAKSKRELALIRRLMRQAGFKPGRPFVKGPHFRQPLYGREEVTRFFRLIGDEVAEWRSSGVAE